MPQTCTQSFDITVIDAIPTPTDYFKLDEPTPISSLLNQYGAFPMGIVLGLGGTSAAGKIGTALFCGDGVAFQSAFDAHWVVTGNLTVRIWYNAASNAFSFLILDTEQWQIDNIAVDAFTYQFRLRMKTTAGNKDLLSNSVTYGSWHRLICTFENGVGISVKTDDDPAYTLAFADPLTAYATTRLRQYQNYFTQSNVLDEVGIWNLILSDAQMTMDWNGGAGTTFP